jgi:AraC-like DNA-binding protein
VQKHLVNGLGTIPSAAGVLSRLAYKRLIGAGLDAEPLLKKSGLTAHQISDREARLDAQKQLNFLALAADALNDEFLGFDLVWRADPREMGLIYYISASAETLGDAFLRIARFCKIANEGVSVRVSAGKDMTLSVEYDGISRHSDLHQIEAMIAAFVRQCQQLTRTSLRPTRVTFAHYRKAVPARFTSHLGDHISFAAEADTVSFAKDVKDMPIASADPYLHDLLLTYCEEALARRSAPPVALRSKVENAIAPLLPHGKARLAEVAFKLGVSPRTLARRLTSEGLTFVGILHELRYDLARRYLSEQNLSISRIAWLLGYQEVSAFTHAFKRRSGQTPNRARRAAAATRRRHPRASKAQR